MPGPQHADADSRPLTERGPLVLLRLHRKRFSMCLIGMYSIRYTYLYKYVRVKLHTFHRAQCNSS
jgi:hypothetical protein